MNAPRHLIDFSTVLAAAVHDMKNSLCLLRQSIEELGAELDQLTPSAEEQLACAHYEAARLNTGLVQLLSLYRAEMENLPIHVDESSVDDVVDDVLANNRGYIQLKKRTLHTRIEEGTFWYMDADLIHLLLNDMLVNAMRYCKQNILLEHFVEEDGMVLRIQDDGPGYPESMLKANEVSMQDFDISHGRTGLGLFFARMIAMAHTQDERHGTITLENGGEYGGSVFTLKLP